MSGTDGSPADASDGVAVGERVEVLLVDDDETWATSTAQILEQQREAFAVETATSLAAASAAFAEGDPDCVVSDYQLERGTGLDLLAEVRDLAPDRPFILITGQGDESVASDAIGREVTDYIPKRSLGGRDQGSQIVERPVVRARAADRSDLAPRLLGRPDRRLQSLAGRRQVRRPLRDVLCAFERPNDRLVRIGRRLVLPGPPAVLPDDARLIEHVLDVLDDVVARADEPLVGDRRQAGEDDHRHARPVGVVHRRAEVLGAHVHVDEHRLWLPRGRRVAVCRAHRRELVWTDDDLRIRRRSVRRIESRGRFEERCVVGPEVREQPRDAVLVERPEQALGGDDRLGVVARGSRSPPVVAVGIVV